MEPPESPLAPAGAVVTVADYEPRRSSRVKFRALDYKKSAASDVSSLSPDNPSSTLPSWVPINNVGATANPETTVVAGASTEVEETQPTSNQATAAPVLKRKRSTPKDTPASKPRGKAAGRSTKTKKVTRAKKAAKKSAKGTNAALKKGTKKATSTNAEFKPEQPALRFQVSDELPHNLGTVPSSLPTDKVPAVSPSGSDKENHGHDAQSLNNLPTDTQAVEGVLTASDENRTEVGKGTDTPTEKKTNARVSYRLTAGKTPYPTFRQPTPAECEEVNRLLSEIHGEVTAPKTIPEPSLTVTGCGEVPSVLDALIRTLLSGATSSGNSALAFDGLVKRFGILSEGIGKGSVNWDAVRQAPLNEVFEAIKRGGLAAIKSKNLKAILDQVYEENQERVKQLEAKDQPANDMTPKMSPEKMEQEKEYRIACADQHFLSLDHVHKLPTPEAMTELVKYPGIGPKTAACVCLFCLQRPCFAVDTHIFRISKWLGWIPNNATEITAFSHLEVRIPDHLKYSLHQLFIKHGKTCPRCRAITGENSVGWEQGCAIDHLVTRTGVRKGGAPPKTRARAKVKVKPAKSTRGIKRKRSGTAPSTTKTKKRKIPTTVIPVTPRRRHPPRNASAQFQVVITSPTSSSSDESSTPVPPTTVESPLVKTGPAVSSATRMSEVASSPSPSTPTPKERNPRVLKNKKKPAIRKPARKSSRTTTKGKGNS